MYVHVYTSLCSTFTYTVREPEYFTKNLRKEEEEEEEDDDDDDDDDEEGERQIVILGDSRIKCVLNHAYQQLE